MKKTLLLILSLILAIGISGGCTPEKTPPKEDEIPPVVDTPVASEEYNEIVSLYFAKDNINSLSVEKRTIAYKTKDDFYKNVIVELVKGPATDSLSATINPNTVVSSVSVNNKTATADFTDSLKAFNTGGSTKEYMCLYSIVNTLCEFPEIDNVRLTITGKAIQTFGQLDTSEPLTKE